MKSFIAATLAIVAFSFPALANETEQATEGTAQAYEKTQDEVKKDAKKEGVIKQKQATQEEAAEQDEAAQDEASY